MSASITVAANPDSIFSLKVDLSDAEWSELLPENLSPFRVEETQRPCLAYRDGIFPGSKNYGKDRQTSEIKRFPNYIEFSKITSDEVVPISGQLYLTTKFYDRRYEGWSSEEILKKEEEIIGYCFNGDVYCVDDKAEIYKMFYGLVYKNLVAKKDTFIKLEQFLSRGIALELTGADEEFLTNLKDILLESLKNAK